MRLPRASAVIVALSTLVAVVTVATVVSQLAPFDRAGALLPEGPIVVSGEPAGDGTAAPAAPTETGTEMGTDLADGASTGSTGDQPAVVAPAPAETVGADPEPAPEPGGPPATSPGNSGNAPGQTGAPGNSGDAPGQHKP